MATPSLVNLRGHFAHADLVLIGSPAVAAMLRPDPTFAAVHADRSKSWRVRLAGLHHLARSVRRRDGPFDLAMAFPNSLSSALLLRFSASPQRVAVARRGRRLLVNHPIPIDPRAHQAEIYNQIVNGYLGTRYETGPTRLHVPQRWHFSRKTAGINPGAAFGSAKRWPADRFAEVAAALAQHYDIAIFGAAPEAAIAGKIAATLRRRGINNFQNVAGQTSLSTLLSMIAGLDLIITNDSGPMHIAGALGIPTVAIFGSTNHVQTCPWRHGRSVIVRHDLPCAPCMRRTCPLEHHECMDAIHAQEVIDAACTLMT